MESLSSTLMRSIACAASDPFREGSDWRMDARRSSQALRSAFDGPFVSVHRKIPRHDAIEPQRLAMARAARSLVAWRSVPAASKQLGTIHTIRLVFEDPLVFRFAHSPVTA